MKRIPPLFFLALWFSVDTLLTGCQQEFEIDFWLNGEKYPSIQDLVGSETDSLAILRVQTGDTIRFTDMSKPIGKIKSRFWDVDGDGVFEEELKDQKSFYYGVQEEGIIRATLCINDKKQCVSKQIMVTPGAATAAVEFSIPAQSMVSSSTSQYLFEIRTANISEKDELLITHNGEGIENFEFDPETGKVTGEIFLEEGSNIIKVISFAGGSAEDEAVVEYEAPIPVASSATTPAPPKKPTVKITKPAQGMVVDQDVVEMEFSAENVKRKGEIKINLNGKEIDVFQYSGKTGQGKVAVTLKKGSNNLKLTATTAGGTQSESLAVTYKPKQVEIRYSGEGTVGLPGSQYDNNCAVSLVQPRISIPIFALSNVQLKELFVWSDVCGGLEVILSDGNGKSKSFRRALTGGKNQILFNEEDDARLDEGENYTLTLKPFADFGNCSGNPVPKLKEAKNCPILSKNAPQLRIDQKSTPIIYDLKFLY